LPKFLGSWWNNSRRAWLCSFSKARWVCFGREEPATKAPKPRLLKSWMASRTVWEPHPTQRVGYLRGAFASVAGEDDLGSAHDESFRGT
jgi:hypothetical protein